MSHVWLVGAGAMAVEYAKVLDNLAAPYLVVGRGAASAEKFSATTGVAVISGGLAGALHAGYRIPHQAIVAVGATELFDVAAQLISLGVKQILLEKPGCLYRFQFNQLAEMAAAHNAEIVVAYNRRFYSSVAKAKELIAQDGGVTSFQFEFTEWSHLYLNSDKSAEILARTLVGNSSHIIDLAFHLGGMPSEMHCYRSGSLSWHQAGARFSGAGITDRGVTFSYSADWQAAGRWSVEVMTKAYRYILRPLEGLQRIKTGTLAVEQVVLDDTDDTSFKPGLLKQVSAFLKHDFSLLCSAREQITMFDLYYQIAGYSDSELF